MLMNDPNATGPSASVGVRRLRFIVDAFRAVAASRVWRDVDAYAERAKVDRSWFAKEDQLTDKESPKREYKTESRKRDGRQGA